LKEFVDLKLLKEDYTPGSMKFFNSKENRSPSWEQLTKRSNMVLRPFRLKDRISINMPG
jgi:hypothetical protein